MKRCLVYWSAIVLSLGLVVSCGSGPTIAYKELLDEDPQVRADAARRLGDARAADAVESLIAMLDDPSEDVRVTAMIALGEIGDRSATPALVDLVDDPLVTVRLQLSQTLGKLEDPEAVPTLTKLLHDPDETVRVSATGALGGIGTPEAIDALVNIALLDEQEWNRSSVVRVLAGLGHRDSVPLLEQALSGESDLVRANAAYALRELADESSIPSLIEALDDPFNKVRSLAAHCLGSIGAGDPAVAAALRARLEVEDSEMTQVDLAWNLAKCGDRSKLDIVRTLLFRGTEEDVRAEAAIALGDVGDSSDIPLLEKAIQDKKGLVRKEAFEAHKKLKEA